MAFIKWMDLFAPDLKMVVGIPFSNDEIQQLLLFAFYNRFNVNDRIFLKCSYWLNHTSLNGRIKLDDASFGINHQ